MGNFLSVGRAIGLDNVNQLQKLRKTVMSEKPGTFVGQFKLVGDRMDVFTSIDKNQEENFSAISKLVKRIFPKSTSGKSETILDVVLRKFNSGKIMDGTASLACNSVTKLGHEVVGVADLKVLNNQAGIVVDMTSKGEAGAKVNFNLALSKLAKPENTMLDVVKSLNYTENNGIGKLTGDVRNKGIIRNLQLEAEAPAEYFDVNTSLASGGQFPKFSNFLSDRHNLIRTIEAENSGNIVYL